MDAEDANSFFTIEKELASMASIKWSIPRLLHILHLVEIVKFRVSGLFFGIFAKIKNKKFAFYDSRPPKARTMPNLVSPQATANRKIPRFEIEFRHSGIIKTGFSFSFVYNFSPSDIVCTSILNLKKMSSSRFRCHQSKTFVPILCRSKRSSLLRKKMSNVIDESRLN